MKTINLTTHATKAPDHLDKDAIKEETKGLLIYLDELQNLLYANKKHSVLVVLQGMDAAGKDGAIRGVSSQLNPMGCHAFGFKAPSEEELAHDFLWRVNKLTPAKGMINVFNRSHYEDILVPSVEGFIDSKIVDQRYKLINAFEKGLDLNNTVVIKFFIHISKEEQKERLAERLHIPRKMWKYNPNDHEVSKKWDDYQAVYHKIFKKCNPHNAP